MLKDDEKPESVETTGSASERHDIDGGVRQRLEGLIPDLVKKTLSAGLDAVFNTEEGIRKLAAEIPMPKEVASNLRGSINSTKDEILRSFTGELRNFLQSLNLAHEVAKALSMISLEIKTEVRFLPREEGGVRPDVKSTVGTLIRR
ncbi:MAG: hypothetical protein V2A73_21850 [Pseudomonadota bacterium]